MLSQKPELRTSAIYNIKDPNFTVSIEFKNIKLIKQTETRSNLPKNKNKQPKIILIHSKHRIYAQKKKKKEKPFP